VVLVRRKIPIDAAADKKRSTVTKLSFNFGASGVSLRRQAKMLLFAKPSNSAARG
jgi:hypothetical protein